ncbi:hypothetical protein DV735_g2733, partial [Chaetothyriales sp. CBS 134920]
MGIAPFAETPVEDIPKIVARVKQAFYSHKTRPIEFRLKQLRKLYWAIEDHQADILEACERDLGKGFYEAMLAEITWVQNDIIFITKNLEKWAKDEKPEDISLTNKFVSPRIRKDPLGAVLVIGAFNFPINLSLSPMVGAISAGNTVVLKPSEQSSYCASIMQTIIEQSLDPEAYAVVQGGIPETQALLAEKWDKIFFTGSANTAKVIVKAAANFLTPVALELGGRNPAFVTRKANIHLAARRLLWSKTMNAGQVCISQNYTLVDKEVLPTFVTEIQAAFKEFFPNGAKDNPDYGKIVNQRSFDRLKKMLDESSGKIVLGGTTDASKLFFEPTVVVVNDVNDSLLAQESFGPLLPLLGVDNLDQAISIANSIHDTPLGVYAFGSKEETDKVLRETRSGGASINDGFFHGVIPTLPFGGVGDSGSGAYRGKASFEEFTHRRSYTTTPNWLESLLAVRYPPFLGAAKFKQYAAMSVLKPNFDRQGREKINWLWYVLTLAMAEPGVLAAIKGAPFNPILTGPLLFGLLRPAGSGSARLRERLVELLGAQGASAAITTLGVLFSLGLVGRVNSFLNTVALRGWRLKQPGPAWNFAAPARGRGEIILITGGCSGFGLKQLKLFAERAPNATLVTIDRQPLPAELAAAIPHLKYYNVDLTDFDSLRAVAETIKKEVGNVTVLINNAGIASPLATILDRDVKDWQRVFAVNVFAHVPLIQAFLPDMLAKQKGHIVTFASMASYVTVSGIADYSASKAAVNTLHDTLRFELLDRYGTAGAAINTTSVHPTWAPTGLTDGWMKAPSTVTSADAVGNAVVNQVLAGRRGKLFVPPQLANVLAIIALPYWVQEVARTGLERGTRTD